MAVSFVAFTLLPIAMADNAVVTASLPMATPFSPVTARLKRPMAIELCMPASARVPTAILSLPVACIVPNRAPDPIATALSALALTPNPTATANRLVTSISLPRPVELSLLTFTLLPIARAAPLVASPSGMAACTVATCALTAKAANTLATAIFFLPVVFFATSDTTM